MQVPALDQAIGLEVYSTGFPGVGGKIKLEASDFLVEEVLEPSLAASVGSKGRYLLCRVAKTDTDTFHALELIRSALRCPRGSIAIAGIKDAKAKTQQHITLRAVSATRVRALHLQRIEIEPIGYLNEPVTSRAIGANRFTVRIREVDRDIMESDIGQVRMGGFANFFGYQRFGSIRPISHDIGRAIVKRDFQNAVNRFIGVSFATEPYETRTARNYYATNRDPAKALEEFPVHLSHERSMLEHLSAHPGDYLGALRCLPLRLLRLLVQAYQAYLFNLELSDLLAESGDFESIASTTETLPLPGYLTREIDLEGSLGRLMAEEGVSLRDFYVGPLWELSAPGGHREIRVLPGDFRHAAPQNASIEVSFLLPRGAYATTLLREIIKPENPVAAGF